MFRSGHSVAFGHFIPIRLYASRYCTSIVESMSRRTVSDRVPVSKISGQPIPVIATLLLASFLLLPSMASIGMFMDGIIYAAISRNLANGEGALWTLHFSQGLFPVFREHPPLVFWLQSSFFRVLGDSYLTERTYDLAVLLATALLMRLLWRKLTIGGGHAGLAGYWWLPLLLWVVVPKWSWAYRNNVLESTMTLFCLLSVLLVLAGLQAKNMKTSAVLAGGAAAAALLAFLAKGPVALFALATPVLLLPALRHIDWRRVALVLLALLGVFALGAGLLLAWPAAREMLLVYWQKQVVGRAGLSGAGIDMLFELAKKLAPMLVALAALRLWVWMDGAADGWKAARGPAAAMLATGLAASLPLVLGDLDSAHYLVPALPFYALGLGLIGAAMLEKGGSRVRRAVRARPGRLFKLVAGGAAVAILAMTMSRLGDVRRNVDYHAFLAQVAETAGERSSLGIDATLYDDWYLHAIAQRHYRISLVSGLSNAEWRLAPAGQAHRPGYRTTDVAVGQWILLRRQTAP